MCVCVYYSLVVALIFVSLMQSSPANLSMTAAVQELRFKFSALLTAQPQSPGGTRGSLRIRTHMHHRVLAKAHVLVACHPLIISKTLLEPMQGQSSMYMLAPTYFYVSG